MPDIRLGLADNPVEYLLDTNAVTMKDHQHHVVMIGKNQLIIIILYIPMQAVEL